MLLHELIRRLIEILERQEELPAALANRSRELQERLASGQLHLAVLGQFKRGKSSLINALLGAEILPQGVLPVTLIPTFIRYGNQPQIRVVFEDERVEIHPLASLRGFVSELENPRNQKAVRQVDVNFPSALLRQGIVLIDTPGIGSTHQHNTEATLSALPRFDAGVMVLSADPPITAAEVEFLQQICQHVAHLFFVLNKIDYLKRSSDSAHLHSQDVADAEDFLWQALEPHLALPEPQIFPLSASEGLEAQMEKDPALWEMSGMASFEAALFNLANHGREAVLVQAIQQKAHNIITEADHLLALYQQTLRLPLIELEQRIEVFEGYADTARQKRQEIKDRLVGDKKRLRVFLEGTTESLRQRALSELEQLASQMDIPSHDPLGNEAFQQTVDKVFDREREEGRQQVVEELYSVLESRAAQALAIREKLRREASDLLAVSHVPLVAEDSRVDLAEPTWVLKQEYSEQTPGFGEALLPETIRARREMERRRRLAQELTVRNGEKIRWWLIKMVEETLRRFQTRIENEMEETIRQIGQALQLGRERHRLGVGEMEAALAGLERSRADLRQLEEALGQDRTGQSDRPDSSGQQQTAP